MRNGLKAAIAVLGFLLGVLSCFPASSHAQANRGPSTPDERARALKVAKELRSDPLSPGIQADREWLIRWLIEVPDFTVPLCTEFMAAPTDQKDAVRGALVATMMAGEAAFIIENPSKAKDKDAIYLAGVQSALDAYKAIRATNSGFSDNQLDSFEKSRAENKLEEAVHSRAKKCKRG